MTDTDKNNEPVHWFQILNQALNAGKIQEAERAQVELQECGYYIKWFPGVRKRKRPSSTKGGLQ